MADLSIDTDVEARIARSADVQADMLRRGNNVASNARRIVHVDPTRNVAKEGPHLRDTIEVVVEPDGVRVGSDARYAQAEEFGDSPKHGGIHSFLRASLNAAGR